MPQHVHQLVMGSYCRRPGCWVTSGDEQPTQIGACRGGRYAGHTGRLDLLAPGVADEYFHDAAPAWWCRLCTTWFVDSEGQVSIAVVQTPMAPGAGGSGAGVLLAVVSYDDGERDANAMTYTSVRRRLVEAGFASEVEAIEREDDPVRVLFFRAFNRKLITVTELDWATRHYHRFWLST